MTFFQDEHPKLHNNYENGIWPGGRTPPRRLFTRKVLEEYKSREAPFRVKILVELSNKTLNNIDSLFCVYVYYQYGKIYIEVLCLLCNRRIDPPYIAGDRLHNFMQYHILSHHIPNHDLIRDSNALISATTDKDLLANFDCELSDLSKKSAYLTFHEIDSGDKWPYWFKYYAFSCCFCGMEYSVPPVYDVVVSHLRRCEIIKEVMRIETDNAKIE